MHTLKEQTLYIPLTAEAAQELFTHGLNGLKGKHCSKRPGYLYSSTDENCAWNDAEKIARENGYAHSILLTLSYKGDYEWLLFCHQGNIDPVTIWSGTARYLSDNAIGCFAKGGRNCPPAIYSLHFKPLA